MQEASEVATIILKQLRSSKRNATYTIRWGMKALRYGSDNKLGYNAPFLHFRVTGLKFHGVVRIYLNVMDEYTVLFMNLVGEEQMERIDGVADENLCEAINFRVEGEY